MKGILRNKRRTKVQGSFWVTLERKTGVAERTVMLRNF